MNINLSFLERVVSEDREKINKMNEEEVKELVNSFLYKLILDNIFEDYIKEKVIEKEIIDGIVVSNGVRKIVNIYLQENNYKIIDNKVLTLKNE